MRDYARQLLDIEQQTFDEQSKGRMLVGNLMEDDVRNYYSKVKNVRVREVGMAVPHFEPRIGDSPDAVVYTEEWMDKTSDNIVVDYAEGTAEIKCSSSKASYNKLESYCQQLSSGYVPDPYEYAHLPQYYYDQMQGHTNVFDKEWCDFIFYYIPSDLVYMEKVNNHHDYWNNYALPGLQYFLDNLYEIAYSDPDPV